MTCPIMPGVEGILEGGDPVGLDWLAVHAQTCGDCRAEIGRLEKAKKAEDDAWAKKVLSVLGTLAIFFIGRGVTNAINQTLHNSGHWTPPWFKPRK